MFSFGNQGYNHCSFTVGKRFFSVSFCCERYQIDCYGWFNRRDEERPKLRDIANENTKLLIFMSHLFG